MTGSKAQPTKPLVGAHFSIAGGVYNAPLKALELGATTLQIFTANQKQWKPKAISDEDADKWHEVVEGSGLEKIMSHDSYLINLGSGKPDIAEKSITLFGSEIQRCQKLNLSYLNFHPGAATGDEEKVCLDRICDRLNTFSSHFKDDSLTLLLETTAGQGTTVGYSFEQLGYIIKNTHKHVPIGVCIDTCHIFSAGYDIRDQKGWDETLKAFDEHIGLSYLKALHVNDSLKPLASRKDRHANLGEGEIGIECFKVMMRHPKMLHLPKYLETPNGDVKWKEEIAMLKQFQGETTCQKT